MKEFQDIHYHVILVESMTRSRNAEQAVKELVDDLVETAHIQGRRANEVPLFTIVDYYSCLLYTSPSPRDLSTSRMPSSA